MSYDSSTPVRFPRARNLPEGVRALVCNGIGPARGKSLGSRIAWTLSTPPLAVAYLLGLRQAFREAGDDHDLHYFMGGDARAKRLADGVFLGQLLDAVSHWGPLLRPIGWSVAVSYWLAVAALGWGSFKRREAPLQFGQVSTVASSELTNTRIALSQGGRP